MSYCFIWSPDVCTLHADAGPCRASFERYYFDGETNQCHRFIYGGCQGNGNNFESIDACQSKCSEHIALTLPPGTSQFLRLTISSVISFSIVWFDWVITERLNELENNVDTSYVTDWLQMYLFLYNVLWWFWCRMSSRDLFLRDCYVLGNGWIMQWIRQWIMQWIRQWII